MSDSKKWATAAMVSQFAANMCQELKQNEHKGDFSDWNPDLKTLMSEVSHHMGKLNQALYNLEDSAQVRCERVREYAADVGNYMAKITQMYGSGETKLESVPYAEVEAAPRGDWEKFES